MKESALLPTRLVLLLTTLALAACGGVKVKTEHEPGTDFSSFRTYSWVADPKILSLHPLIRSEELDGHIRGVVDRELTTKGYRRSGEEPADLVVRYWGSVLRKTGSTKVREKATYDRGGGWVSWYSVGSNTHDYGYDFKEGNLVIEILLPGTKNPVWRGVAEAASKEDASKEERRERLDNAIREMFKDFPPR